MNVNLNLCAGCLEKQQKIDRLEEENQRLRQQLRRQQRQAGEGPFGSSTPSAKIPLKANTPEEERSKPGGARPGCCRKLWSATSSSPKR